MTPKSILIILHLIILGTSAVFAQEREITKAEFWDYFRRSKEATKGISFREKVTVEKGDLPTGPWAPYSSWVNECILPDRSRLVYTSGRVGEFIYIGKTGYRKEPDGRWIRNEEAPPIVSPPASQFVYAAPVHFRFLDADKANGRSFTVRVVSGAESVTDMDTDTKTYTYSFNEDGVLVKSIAVVFNGTEWLRRTEIFEYDPSIRIDAPAN